MKPMELVICRGSRAYITALLLGYLMFLPCSYERMGELRNNSEHLGSVCAFAQPPNRDKEPPSIEIFGVEDTTEYWGVTLEIYITAYDDRDPNVVIEADLNGEPVDAYGAIRVSKPGYYTLRVVARDSSGNYSRKTYDFTIRERPLYRVFVIPHQIALERTQHNKLKFSGVFFIASRDIDVAQINLYTLILWLESDDRTPLAALELPRNKSAPPPQCGPYPIDTEVVDPVVASKAYLRVRWEGEIPIPDNGTLPTRFLLTGAGYSDPETILFDIEGEGELKSDETPLRTLQRLGISTEVPEVPVVGDNPPRRCAWKYKVIPLEKQDRSFSERNSIFSNCVWVEELNPAVAYGKVLDGLARAIDECPGGDEPSVAEGIVRSGYDYRVWLEPPDACRKPVILYTLEPSFNYKGEIDPSARACVAGLIDILALQTRVSARALGGFSCGNTEKIKINLGVGASGLAAKIVFEQNQDCRRIPPGIAQDLDGGVYRGNCLDIRCRTAMSISAWANATFLDSSAKAYARLYEASPCIRIEASCEDCGTNCPTFKHKYGCSN